MTFYFPSSVTEDEKTAFEDATSTLCDVLGKHAEGFRGASKGWVVEEVEHSAVGKGYGYVVAVGWDSVDAHMAFRETGEFKGAIGQIRERATATVMFHVPFQTR